MILKWHCIRCVKTVITFFSPVGLYYCFNNLSDATIFIIMYGVTSMYFSAVMVRHFSFILVSYWSWFIDISLFTMEALTLVLPVLLRCVSCWSWPPSCASCLALVFLRSSPPTWKTWMSADRTRNPRSSRTPPTQSRMRYDQMLRLIFLSFARVIGSLSVMLCSDWSVGGEWDDSGHGVLPHHIHFPLHLGDQWGILLPLNRAVRTRWWWQPHHLRWLQRGLLLAQTQHTWGQWDPSRHRPS